MATAVQWQRAPTLDFGQTRLSRSRTEFCATIERSTVHFSTHRPRGRSQRRMPPLFHDLPVLALFIQRPSRSFTHRDVLSQRLTKVCQRARQTLIHRHRKGGDAYLQRPNWACWSALDRSPPGENQRCLQPGTSRLNGSGVPRSMPVFRTQQAAALRVVRNTYQKTTP